MIKTVVAKPNPVFSHGGGFLIVMGIACGMGMVADAPQQGGALPLLMALLGGGFMSALGGVSLLYARRCQIISDTEGLRWRGLLGAWQGAAWSEVVRYGYEPASKSSEQAVAVVRLRDGRKLVLDSTMTQMAYLREAIVERATEAPMDSWEYRSDAVLPQTTSTATAQAKAPLEFGTRSGDLWTLRLFILPGIPAALWLPAKLALTIPRDAAQGTLGWWTWASLAFIALICLPLAGMAAYLSWIHWRHTRPMKVVITSDTLRIEERGSEPLLLGWHEIKGLRTTPRGLEITHRNGTVWIPLVLQRYRIAATLIFQRAPKAARRTAMEPTEAPETARDVRCYSYRRREVLLLWYLPLVTGIAAGIARAFSLSAGPYTLDVLLPTGVLVALGLMGIVWTCLARVETSLQGIALITPWGRRGLRWNQIEDYRLEGANLLVEGAGKRLRIGVSVRARQALIQEIAARAPRPRTGWPTGFSPDRSSPFPD